jgi:hypothetical protein
MGMTRFFETIETLKSEIFTPLFKVISEMFTPEVIQITQAFSAMGKALSKLLGEWLEKRMPTILKNLHKTVENLIKDAGPLIDLVVLKLKNFANSLEPFINLFILATEKIRPWIEGWLMKEKLKSYMPPSNSREAFQWGINVAEWAQRTTTPETPETDADRIARERREADPRTIGERISESVLKGYREATASEALRDDVEARRDTMAETVFSRITNDDFRELLGLTAEQVEISRRIVERTSLVTSPGAIGSEAP